MAHKKHGIIIETLTEARQAERGPSILSLLIISLHRPDRDGGYLVLVLPHLMPAFHILATMFVHLPAARRLRE